jgi:hypothetical protein
LPCPSSTVSLDTQLFGFVFGLCFHESAEWECEIGNYDDDAFILSLGRGGSGLERRKDGATPVQNR